eukprot:EG_transcript_8161
MPPSLPLVFSSIAVNLVFVFLLWATVTKDETEGVDSFLRRRRRPSHIALSGFECTPANSSRDRRCVFRNLYVVGRVLWFVSDAPVEVPAVLCTAVDGPPNSVEPWAHNCSVEWHSPHDVDALLDVEGSGLLMYDTGLAFSRLNPHNPYHVLFEDYLPIYEMIRNTPVLRLWLEPPAPPRPAAPPPPKATQLLVFQDKYAAYPVSAEYGHILFPEARRLDGPDRELPAVFLVRHFVAGTLASCVHAAHCSRGRFLTLDIGTEFRRFLLRQLGLPDRGPPPRAPHVAIVQRVVTRRIANIDDIIGRINAVLARHTGGRATVVEYTRMTLRQQLEAALHTDVLIFIHGGAFGHVMFLPPHAIVVDIYPYGFLPELHGYIMNGIRLTMPSMGYGHVRLQTNDSTTTLLRNGECLLPNCVGHHTARMFLNAQCLIVDAAALEAQFTAALLAWCHATFNASGEPRCRGSAAAAAAVYAAPPSSAEFNARAAAVSAAADLRGPLCDTPLPCDATGFAPFPRYQHCGVAP